MIGRLRVDWWRAYNNVRFAVGEQQHFTMGKASGHQCNCLIDTLRQQLQLDCNIGAVRAYVRDELFCAVLFLLHVYTYIYIYSYATSVTCVYIYMHI